MKRFRFLILIIIALLDIVSVFYLIKLILPINERISELLMYSTIILTVAAFLLTTVYCVALKVFNNQDRLEMRSAVYKVFNAISFALFMIYSIIFVIITNGMERGTPAYMEKMHPGLIPLVPGALLNIISKI